MTTATATVSVISAEDLLKKWQRHRAHAAAPLKLS